MNIYAILDTKANAIIGGLQLHKHPSAAIRTFGDIAADPKSMIARHPEDYELIELGTLHEDASVAKGFNHCIQALPEHEVIITGKAWAAAQRPADIEHNTPLTVEK